MKGPPPIPALNYARIKVVEQSRPPVLVRAAQFVGRLLRRVPVISRIARRMLEWCVPWLEIERQVSSGRFDDAFSQCRRLSAKWGSKAPGSMADWILLQKLGQIVETLATKEAYELLLVQARIDRSWVGIEASWAALSISRAAHACHDRAEARRRAQIAFEADETEPNAAAWLAWMKLSRGEDDAVGFLNHIVETNPDVQILISSDLAFQALPAISGK